MTSANPPRSHPSPPPPPPLLLALAGPTSSGKTTLASALSHIFSPTTTSSLSQTAAINPLTIIHADDFYLPDSKIPTLADGTQDWDCAEALDIPRFHSVLSAVRNGGEVPWDLVRQGGLEDGERGGGSSSSGGAIGVEGAEKKEQIPEQEAADGVHGAHSSSNPLISTSTITRLRSRALNWPSVTQKRCRRIVLVEGIFLFSPSTSSPLSPLTPLYDIKILLRTRRSAAKKRREARNGYVTLEGFWRDPPGYFDRVVWPGFQAAYGGFFVGGDVEGEVDEVRVGERGVLMGPLVPAVAEEEEEGEKTQESGRGKGEDLEGVLAWIMQVLEKELLVVS